MTETDTQEVQSRAACQVVSRGSQTLGQNNSGCSAFIFQIPPPRLLRNKPCTFGNHYRRLWHRWSMYHTLNWKHFFLFTAFMSKLVPFPGDRMVKKKKNLHNWNEWPHYQRGSLGILVNFLVHPDLLNSIHQFLNNIQCFNKIGMLHLVPKETKTYHPVRTTRVLARKTVTFCSQNCGWPWPSGPHLCKERGITPVIPKWAILPPGNTWKYFWSQMQREKCSQCYVLPYTRKAPYNRSHIQPVFRTSVLNMTG